MSLNPGGISPHPITQGLTRALRILWWVRPPTLESGREEAAAKGESDNNYTTSGTFHKKYRQRVVLVIGLFDNVSSSPFPTIQPALEVGLFPSMSTQMQISVQAPRAILPQESERALINQAIHEAVCEATTRATNEESDGFGQCAAYAMVTMLVMSELTGRRYLLQAGNLHLELSEEYRHRHPLGATHLSMISDPLLEGGPSRALLPFPEFHAWVGAIHLTPEEQQRYTDHAERLPAYEVIDLSARHYLRHVRALDPDWREPQDFTHHPLWTTADQLPSWLLLEPIEQTTRDVAEVMSEPERRRIIIAATKAALSALGGQGLTRGSISSNFS
jgi:hypothetical protein